MNRDDVEWRGYWPAAPTPFTASGEIDDDRWEDLLTLYVRQGVSGVLVNGSTGEWFSQSPAERRHLAERAVAVVGGSVPVVVGVSAYTAAEAAMLARHAETAGAAGVLATPPPYVHPSAAEILAFYAEVSGATHLPFMVYNWPRGVVVDMARLPGLMGRLAALDRVVAIKDSTGDAAALRDTVEAVADEVRVFGGFLTADGLDLLLAGRADGNIDGGGVGAPFAVPFYAAVARRDRVAALTHLARYERLAAGLVRSDYSAIHASPISQLKAVMALLGQPGGHVRPPLLPLEEPDALAAIGRVLDAAGLPPLTDAAPEFP